MSISSVVGSLPGPFRLQAKCGNRMIPRVRRAKNLPICEAVHTPVLPSGSRQPGDTGRVGAGFAHGTRPRDGRHDASPLELGLLPVKELARSTRSPTDRYSFVIQSPKVAASKRPSLRPTPWSARKAATMCPSIPMTPLRSRRRHVSRLIGPVVKNR